MKKWIIALILSVSIPMTAVAREFWVDVRSAQEFNQGHLKGATLIPYNQISAKIRGLTANKHSVINLYCRSGRRAQIAQRTLARMGYTSVQNRGSLETLKAQGMK